MGGKRAKKIERPNPKNKKEKMDLVKNLMREGNKKYEGVSMHFGKQEKDWGLASTGIPEIDEFLGGGFPHSKPSIIWGGEATGKSTLMYLVIAQAQREGKVVAYLDIENSFNKERAELFGVDLEELIIGHFKVAEHAMNTIIDLTNNKAVDVIILDSIHSLSPKGEQEEKSGKDKSVENDTMALLARKLAQFFRMASSGIYTSNCAFIMVGQTRTSVGFIAYETLSGGHALKHNSVLTVNIRKGQKADAPTKNITKEDGKKEKIIVGFDAVLKIDKSKMSDSATEGTKLHIPFYFDRGFIQEKLANPEKPEIQMIEEGEDKPKKKRRRPSKKDKS